MNQRRRVGIDGLRRLAGRGVLGVLLLGAVAMQAVASEGNVLAAAVVGEAGETVAVEVALELAPGVEVATLQMNLTVVAQGGAPAMETQVTFTSSVTAPSANLSGGTATRLLGWFSPFEPGLTGTGALGVLNVSIPVSALEGSVYEVQVVNPSASDADFADILLAGVSGSITVDVGQATPTPPLSTATPTSEPTSTAVPTDTPLPMASSTQTFTITGTPSPAASSTPTWTATAAIPMATPTPTALPTSTPAIPKPCPGDANHNSFINFADFGAVQQNFGRSCANFAFCGNGIIEGDEECDLWNLIDETCENLGFAGGVLGCTPGCMLATNGCWADRFVDNGDGTISDRQTGLMWAKKSDDDSTHDKDNTYTWGSAAAPYQANGTAFTEYIATLNGAPNGVCFADKCDWRIPTREELMSLFDPNEPAPKIDPIFKSPCAPGCSVTAMDCSCMQSATYWSGTTRQDDPANAWRVSFNVGFVLRDKEFSDYVRAVRSSR